MFVRISCQSWTFRKDMTDLNSIAFFGYGGENMGMGHIVRIEALAEAFLDKYPGIRVTLVVPEYEHGLSHLKKVLENRVNLLPVHKKYAHGNELPEKFPDCDVAIFDCLQNSAERVCAARQKSSFIVLFDDNGPGILEADMSFNPMYLPKVEPKNFKTSKVVVFDAPGFMPLRQEFIDFNGQYDISRILGKKKKVLVLQGGADGWNGLTRIIKKMYEIRDDVVAVAVAGTAYTHESEMEELINSMKREVYFKRGLSNIHEIMLECDAAISGCGLSIFELVCLGMPTIALTDEDKELETAQRLEEEGCILNMGKIKKLSNEKFRKGLNKILDDKNFRKSVYSEGTKKINGKGADSIVKEIVKRFDVN